MSVQYIQHKHARILQIEFPSGMTPGQIAEIMAEAESAIAANPHHSLLTLTIFGDFHFDTDMTKKFEQYADHNKPFVKAAAVIGITGLRKVIYSAITFLSHRNIKVFEDAEQAKDYLANLA